MTNLLTVLPEVRFQSFAHILPSLERSLITTADLLTLEPLDLAKRASVPPGEVKKLCDALLEALHSDIDGPNVKGRDISIQTREERDEVQNGLAFTRVGSAISTLDNKLDATIGGGIASGYLTEIVGERWVELTSHLQSH